jgi:hypothetical protein
VFYKFKIYFIILFFFSAKRKRRSKNEKDGRNFKCEICEKSYLSQPALTNHKKSKHHQNDPEFKRGRGRPRKYVILISRKLIYYFSINLNSQ